MIMMMMVNDLVATTVIDVMIYCSSLFVLKAQKVNTKMTVNDLVVVDKKEEEEIIMGATTTTMTILYLLWGWEWSVM